MAEKEQERPLAVAAYEETATTSPTRGLHNRRCILCCGFCSAAILLLTITVLVLALTVFRIRSPELTMNSISIKNSSAFSLAFPNASLASDVSIKNPNFVSFRYKNNTAYIFYKEKVIGEGQIPEGISPARQTVRMNLTVHMLPEKIIGDANFLSDVLSAKRVSVSSFTRVGGRVTVLKVFKRHVVVVMNCTITMSVKDMAIQAIVDQKCKNTIKF